MNFLSLRASSNVHPPPLPARDFPAEVYCGRAGLSPGQSVSVGVQVETHLDVFLLSEESDALSSSRTVRPVISGQ